MKNEHRINIIWKPSPCQFPEVILFPTCWTKAKGNPFFGATLSPLLPNVKEEIYFYISFN